MQASKRDRNPTTYFNKEHHSVICFSRLSMYAHRPASKDRGIETINALVSHTQAYQYKLLSFVILSSRL